MKRALTIKTGLIIHFIKFLFDLFLKNLIIMKNIIIVSISLSFGVLYFLKKYR